MESTFNLGEYITPQKRPRKKPETPVRKWTAEERDKLCELKRLHGDLTIDEFHKAFDSHFPGRSAGAIHQEWLHLKKDPTRQLQLITNTSHGSRPGRSKIVILKMNKRPMADSIDPVGIPSKEPRLERQSSPEASDDDDGDVDFDGRKQRFQTSSSKSPSVPRQHRTIITPTRAVQPHSAQNNQQSQASISTPSSQWSQSGPMALGINAVPQTHLNNPHSAQIPQPDQFQESGITQPLPQGYTTVSASQGPNYPSHTASAKTLVNANQYNQPTLPIGPNGVPSDQASYDARNRSMTSKDMLTKEVPKQTPLTASASSHNSELPPNNASQSKRYSTTHQNIPLTIAPSQPQPTLYISDPTETQCLQSISELLGRLTHIWSERNEAQVKQCIANEALSRNLKILQSRLADMEKEMEGMKRERESERDTIRRSESFRHQFLGLVAVANEKLNDDDAGPETQGKAR